MLHAEHGTAEAQEDRQRAGMSKRRHDGDGVCILVIVISGICAVTYDVAGNLLIDGFSERNIDAVSIAVPSQR